MSDTPTIGENMYEDVMRYLLPEWKREFRMGAEDYGDAFRELGCKGQYSDLHRKMAKLKRNIWEGKSLKREKADAIAFDLIGHCFILIWLLRHTEEGAEMLGRDR